MYRQEVYVFVPIFVPVCVTGSCVFVSLFVPVCVCVCVCVLALVFLLKHQWRCSGLFYTTSLWSLIVFSIFFINDKLRNLHTYKNIYVYMWRLHYVKNLSSNACKHEQKSNTMSMEKWYTQPTKRWNCYCVCVKEKCEYWSRYSSPGGSEPASIWQRGNAGNIRGVSTAACMTLMTYALSIYIL